jgi:hypothetical protein
MAINFDLIFCEINGYTDTITNKNGKGFLKSKYDEYIFKTGRPCLAAEPPLSKQSIKTKIFILVSTGPLSYGL